MRWLDPGPALLLGAVAVPVLIVLYVLKLRRRRVPASSTMLWESAHQDLEANAPFQRLRPNLLLLLQLLALLALLAAFANPVLAPEGISASRLIILIDGSASMKAHDGHGGRDGHGPDDLDPDGPPATRHDEARAIAKRLVDELFDAEAGAAAMVVAVGARPEVVSTFDQRPRRLRAAIDTMEATDEEANLAAALDVAGTFAAAAGESDPPLVVLISDGGVARPADGSAIALEAGRFQFLGVGSGDNGAIHNVGIVSFGARREVERPEEVLVFARLLNAGAEEVQTTVTLFVDDEARRRSSLTLPGAASGPSAGAGEATDSGAPETPGQADPAGDAGTATVSFRATIPAGALLRVEHDIVDSLATDDRAWAMLPPPATPDVLLVGPDGGAPDDYLAELLRGLVPGGLRTISASVFAGMEAREEGADLVVFDRVAPDILPRVSTLTFGALPPGFTGDGAPSTVARRILSWRRQAELLRHVELDQVVYLGIGGLHASDREAVEVLASGSDGPVIVSWSAGGAAHVAVGFALARSNWPADVSVVVFVQNVIEALTRAVRGETSRVWRPDDVVEVAARDREVRVTGSGEPEVFLADDAGIVSIAPRRRAGVYGLDGVEPRDERLAVSVLSALESDLRPRSELAINATPVRARGERETAVRSLRPWLLGLAAVLLLLEWAVYCRRIRG